MRELGYRVSWLEHLSPSREPLLHLFCFPHAGGSANVYREWQRYFSAQVDVCLVHLPGRQGRGRQRPFTRLRSLVNELVVQFAAEAQKPFALFGHSMGALISFELARELSAKYPGRLQHLFVSGHRAPQLPLSEPRISDLPGVQFISELKRLNGTPNEILDNPELMEMFLPVLQADFEIVETYEYQPGPRLSCPITVYSGLHDQTVPGETLPLWNEHTAANCKITMVDGDHFFLHGSETDFAARFRNDVTDVLGMLCNKE